MEWMKAIGDAIDYIESHITEEINTEAVARHVCVSPFYFQKGFSMLCGYTVASPDSFAKAFTRFHGITPSMCRKKDVTLKTFAPLKLTISLKGGYLMDYRITRKESFTVLGVSRTFSYENAGQEVPAFWAEHYAQNRCRYVEGCFGINIDCSMGNESFEYMIADLYHPAADIPEGFVTKTIPAFTWAVFPCIGSLPDALQDVNTRIFSEWLPALKDYEVAAGYCIEMYERPDKYPKGTADENYRTEIWIPVSGK